MHSVLDASQDELSLRSVFYRQIKCSVYIFYDYFMNAITFKDTLDHTGKKNKLEKNPGNSLE